MDMWELRKRYRQNEKAIQDCLEKYKSRYTTKANIVIYRLMCIAMAAELQNILLHMRFGKLDDALASVAKMTDKYLQIAADGNQSIAPTVKRFIGEIDYYYQEAVKIEYEYYARPLKLPLRLLQPSRLPKRQNIPVVDCPMCPTQLLASWFGSLPVAVPNTIPIPGAAA